MSTKKRIHEGLDSKAGRWTGELGFLIKDEGGGAEVRT